MSLLLCVVFTITHREILFSAPDSTQYIDAANHLFQGKFDIYRTPVYPLIICIFQIIFGKTGNVWIWALCACQFIVFLISSHYLKRIAGRLDVSPKVTFWLIAFYLLWPANYNYVVAVLTEIFAVAGVIFFIWFLIKKVWAPRVADIARAVFWLIFLIFERPIFIYLIPILLIWFVILAFRASCNRCWPAVAVGFMGLILACAGVTAYCHVMTRDFGIKGICKISTINNFILISQAGIVCPENTGNPSLRAYLEDRALDYNVDIDAICNDLEYISSKLGVSESEFESYVNTTLRENPRPVLRQLKYRFFEETPQEFFVHKSKKILNPLTPDFRFYWISIFVYLILMIKAWRGSRKIPMTALLLCSISLGIVVASIAGAQAEWDRLTYPGLPAWLLIVGQLISSLSVNFKAFIPSCK